MSPPPLVRYDSDAKLESGSGSGGESEGEPKPKKRKKEHSKPPRPAKKKKEVRLKQDPSLCYRGCFDCVCVCGCVCLTKSIYQLAQNAEVVLRSNSFGSISSQDDGSKKRTKKRKDPNAPKKPMTAYMLWLQENRPAIKKRYPGISVTEISKKAGELWKEVTDKTVSI